MIWVRYSVPVPMLTSRWGSFTVANLPALSQNPPVFDLVTLRLFALAAEHRSLSKTSALANIAVAAVSRRISNFEAELEVRLFHRSRSGVELTPAGKVCLGRTQEILAEIAHLRADMADYRNGMIGSVSVQASTSAVAQFLPDDLSAFSIAHPGIGLELHEAYSAEIVNRIRNGDSELGLIVEGGETFGLTVWPYRVDRLAIVAPRSFRTGVDRLRFADLMSEDLVQMGFETAITRLLSAKASEAGYPMRVRVTVESFGAVCRMISAGFGLGILPEFAAASHIDHSRLRLIELDEPWSVREMLICVKTGSNLSVPSELLISFLRECGSK